MALYGKRQINKIYRGNLGKSRETNKSRGKSMGLGNFGVHGKIEGQHKVEKRELNRECLGI